MVLRMKRALLEVCKQKSGNSNFVEEEEENKNSEDLTFNSLKLNLKESILSIT